MTSRDLGMGERPHAPRAVFECARCEYLESEARPCCPRCGDTADPIRRVVAFVGEKTP